MSYLPEAEWRGPLPTSNFMPTTGRYLIGMTVHHMDGSWQSAEGRFKTPGAEASACYGTRRDGSIICWIDPELGVDYHACQAQWEGYFGVENESDPAAPDAPPTDEQIAAMARIANFHGIPAVHITTRGVAGVSYHTAFPGPCGEAWGQTACPGGGFIDSIDRIVAAMHGDNPHPLPVQEDDMTVWLCLEPGPYQGAWVQASPFLLIQKQNVNEVGPGRSIVVSAALMKTIVEDVAKARTAAGIK
jgi:hypothetical protein